MIWNIPLEKSHYLPFAEVLLRLFKTNEDLKLRISPEFIRLDKKLKNDLGMDSIQVASILYELEENYPHLDESHIPRWNTIEDVLISMSEK